MEILDGRAISEAIFRRYAGNPNGWRYTISPSNSHGFYDALVSNAEESWQIKLDTIFKPNPLVIGTWSGTDRDQDSSPAPLSFGYRELDPLVMRKIAEEVEPTRLVDWLGSLAPVVPRDGRAYAHGPFVLGTVPRKIHGDAQARVDERLSSEMLKLLRSRYPGYG